MNQKARGVIVGTSGFFAGFFTGLIFLRGGSPFLQFAVVMLVSVSVSLIVLKFTGRFSKETGGTP